MIEPRLQKPNIHVIRLYTMQLMRTLPGTGLKTNRMARDKSSQRQPSNVLTAGPQANKVKALLRLWPAAPSLPGQFQILPIDLRLRF